MAVNRRYDEKESFFGVRHVQVFLLFCGLTITYALRVNLSVAIVAMTAKSENNTEEYNWDEKTKGVILSSFFWGYVVTQIPGGYISQKIGAKFLLFFGILICALLNVLTPLCARYGGWMMICGVRVIQGLCQGVIFPSTHTFLAKWAPVEERARLGTYCYSGCQFGTVVMLGSSGMIASSFLGWQSIFYISGCFGIAWSGVWYFFGANMPSEHKSISPEEKEFIEKSLGCNPDPTVKAARTPWGKILKSGAFYSLLVVHCAHTWGFWTLLAEIPTYMNKVLGLHIKQNALLSSLPYLVMWLLSYFFSFLADVLSDRNVVSLNVSRKLFNSLGQWIPMCALIGLAYIQKGQIELAVALLSLAVGLNSATHLGFQINHIDLAPNFAGTLMGITNCAANIMAIIGPLAVGFIVSDETDPVQWRIVFFIAAFVYLIGNLTFVVFGKTEAQSWNEEGPKGHSPVRKESAILESIVSHN